jgi:hypothetical protein
MTANGYSPTMGASEFPPTGWTSNIGTAHYIAAGIHTLKESPPHKS